MSAPDLGAAILASLDEETIRALAERLRPYLDGPNHRPLLTPAQVAERLRLHPKSVGRRSRAHHPGATRDGYGGVKTTKTRSVRTVRLLAPLAADLREWRLASGRPDDAALVFPGIDGRTVTREAWKSWTRRTWAEAWSRQAPGTSHGHRASTTSGTRS